MATVTRDHFTKVEKSWIAYDWANSSYATIIMAAIFPIYFAGVAADAGVAGDVQWGYASSLATLIVAVLAPILGAIGDFRGMKKKLLSAFLLIGLVFTTAMALTDRWQLMLIGYILSYIGFSGSLLFYDSFLTDVTTPDRMDRVSAWGYAMGYIGGSTAPFILSIALIMVGKQIGIDSVLAVKLSVLICVAWWGLFSIPILRNVRQTHYVDRPASDLIASSFRNIKKTVAEILHNKAIFVFMLAYFFYIDGVNTVIHMATVYGTSLGLDSTKMILALLATQLVAVPFSILFGRLSAKVGTIRMISVAIIIYFVICVVGFYMGFSMEQATEATRPAALARATILFWVLSFMVGTCQGGIQALSRSFFGKLIPASRSNEYFGFFDIFGKFAAVLGPMLYSLTADITGRSSLGILSLMLLFAVGLVTIRVGRRHLRRAEAHAEAAMLNGQASQGMTGDSGNGPDAG
jgi:MFS transporter, UMF1 family